MNPVSIRRSCFRGATYVVVLGIASFYLWYWLEMPLYPDEVGFRLRNARYLSDGAFSYGLYPCPSNVRLVPIIFRPASYFLSILDNALGWHLVRAIPIGGVLLILATTLYIVVRVRATAAALILTAGFIGVVGSGLVLFRAEAPMLYLEAACLIGFTLVWRGTENHVATAIFLALLTCVTLVAFHVHPEAIVLTPILLLLALAFAMGRRSRATRVLACLLIIVTVTGASAALDRTKVVCPEYPSVETFFNGKNLSVYAKREGLDGVEKYLGGKLQTFAEQFAFTSKYQVDYLPAVDEESYGVPLQILNFSLRTTVMVNLALALAILAYTAASGTIMLTTKNVSLADRLRSISRSPSFYLSASIAGYLSLLVYDVDTAFYRDLHIHFILVMINTMALSSLRGPLKHALWPIGLACVALSISSTLMNYLTMSESFANGWTGPSIELRTDWEAVRAQTNDVAEKCGIGDRGSGIVMDDLTYDALKHHRHLIPITYIPITYIGTAASPGAVEPFPIRRILKQNSATAIVARCAILDSFGLVPQHQNNGICCLKL
jgi:hypothetical protein